VAGGTDTNTVVTVSRAEYPKYLKLAYPRGEDRQAQERARHGQGHPDDRDGALMLGSITVGESDLRLLARQRAQVAREHILRGKKIETERVFLIEAQVPWQGPAQREGAGSPRRLPFAIAGVVSRGRLGLR